MMSPFDRQSDKTLPPLAGQRLARGVARALRGLDFVTLEEMIPTSGLRVDLMALGPKGEVWVIECKSGPADFRADQKWQGYLEFCDRFFWAVDADFPTDMLPAETGLILADAYDAEIIRMGPQTPLAGARRKAMLQRSRTLTHGAHSLCRRAQLFSDVQRLFRVEIHRQFGAVISLDIDAHHALIGRANLNVGGHVALLVDPHDPPRFAVYPCA